MSDIGKKLLQSWRAGRYEKFGPLKKLTNYIWENGDKNFLFRKVIQYAGILILATQLLLLWGQCI